MVEVIILLIDRYLGYVKVISNWLCMPTLGPMPFNLSLRRELSSRFRQFVAFEQLRLRCL